MSVHRYSLASLAADHCRSWAGVAVTAGPLLFLDPNRTFVYLLAPLAALFALFAGRTLLRQVTRYEITGTGVRAVGPIKTEILWTALADVELRYYSTRRDRGRGWMQLRLKGPRRTIRLDSTLEGFSDIVARAAGEARRRDVALGAHTLENMQAMGITEPSESAEVPTV